MNERQADNQTKTGDPKAAAGRKKKAKTNIERIAEIANRAAKCGMSYGKYVMKYGEELED